MRISFVFTVTDKQGTIIDTVFKSCDEADIQFVLYHTQNDLKEKHREHGNIHVHQIQQLELFEK